MMTWIVIREVRIEEGVWLGIIAILSRIESGKFKRFKLIR